MDTQPQSPASVDRPERNGRLLERLLAVSASRLRSQAERNTARPADVEDALQEACLQFLRRYEGPAEDAAALAWMHLVIKRCAWTLGREGRREPPSFSAGLPAGTEEQAGTLCPRRRGPLELAELEAELAQRREQLARLKRDERLAVLAAAHGYSYQEICARYGWTYTKANRCLVEGRAALRRMDEGER